MHFISFTINLIGWLAVGIIFGILTLQGHRRKKNLTIFLASISALFGGLFSMTTHGMWVDVGIDFFNFFVALSFAIITVYSFIPERREAILNIFAKAINTLNSNLSKRKQSYQNLYFDKNVWKNLNSS